MGLLGSHLGPAYPPDDWTERGLGTLLECPPNCGAVLHRISLGGPCLQSHLEMAAEGLKEEFKASVEHTGLRLENEET